ncbi:MAG: hypothetical protein HDS75_00065 [Bacteroidales bacterium]|nr:hypothetical protein [Bacteroidales bacterium]
MRLNSEPKYNRLDRPGHPDGMTVPEGYFEKFAASMADKLPVNDLERQPAEELKPRSTWMKLRPFVYMAAMFAGIWCTMKMFTMLQQSPADLSAPQTVQTDRMTASLSADEYSDYLDYVWSDYNEADILEDLYNSGYEPTSFQP